MIKKIFCVVIALGLSLSGCISVEIIDDESGSMNTYSREHTEIMTSSDSFGKNKNDDIYIALDYVYSNEEIQENFGDDFEISEEDVICYKSETQTQFFLNRIKGEADYSFAISDSRYRIKLSKEYKEKWKVVSCELEMDEQFMLKIILDNKQYKSFIYFESKTCDSVSLVFEKDETDNSQYTFQEKYHTVSESIIRKKVLMFIRLQVYWQSSLL